MSFDVNNIRKIINSIDFEVLKNGKLKQKGKKKQLDAKTFYADHTDLLSTITLIQFENTIKLIAEEVKSVTADMTTLEGLLAQCDFIYCKFRWFVTKEKTKIYYLKTRWDAEEYQPLTTDRDSIKFFNSVTGNELADLNKLVKDYNLINKGNAEKEPIDEEKVVKYILADIRKNPEYELLSEPVPLTNDPLEPAFKFFDLKNIIRKGNEFIETHSKNPTTPAWDEFLDRIRNQAMREVVHAYITGIFIAKNRAKQCLYVWGNGNDGKSQITEAVADMMGEGVTFVLDQHMRSNQFSSYDAYGKRLFIGEELSAPNVIKNKIFHAITGGSRMRMEAKGEQAFHSRVYACGIITSNEKPLLDDVINQKTRLIYIEVDNASEEKINKSGLKWAEALKKEMEKFIFKGLALLDKYNPTGSSYMLPESHSEDITGRFDLKTQHMEEFIEECFEYDSNSIIRSKIAEGFLTYVNLCYFEKLKMPIPNEYRDAKTAHEIIEKLKSKYPKIILKRKEINGSHIHIIIGLKINKGKGSLYSLFDLPADNRPRRTSVN